MRLEKTNYDTIDASNDQGDYILTLQDSQWNGIGGGSSQTDSMEKKAVVFKFFS